MFLRDSKFTYYTFECNISQRELYTRTRIRSTFTECRAFLRSLSTSLGYHLTRQVGSLSSPPMLNIPLVIGEYSAQGYSLEIFTAAPLHLLQK